MTLTLVPGCGVGLPWADRSLRFGMTLDDVRAAVEPPVVLADTFVCRTAWAKAFPLDGLTVCLFADEAGALAGVSVGRTPDRAVPRVPVGLDDIDLFGWPADEILDALRDLGREVRASRAGAWIDGALRLDWARPSPPVVEPRRKARYEPPPPPAFVDSLCLYARRGPATVDG